MVEMEDTARPSKIEVQAGKEEVKAIEVDAGKN